MQSCLLVLWSDSLTYTVAKALAFSGREVLVWIADVERDQSSDWSLSARIAAIPGVRLVADRNAQPPERVERLIVQGHPQLMQRRGVLDQLASRSVAITVISSGDRSRSPRQVRQIQWRELRWYGRWLRKVACVAYKDGFHALDLWGLWRPRRVVGFDAHSKFLQDQTLFDAIHADDWDTDAARPCLANFLGSRDPQVRERILDSVEPFFTRPGDALARYHLGKRMSWLAYTDAQPAALSAHEFLSALTQSDFTLAPPGYSLVTHRPVEALLRGSIPVLNADELDLYGLGLRDGVNCLAVPPGGWPDAMSRMMTMDEAEIRRMRRNIHTLVADKVCYSALARDIGQRLGVG